MKNECIRLNYDLKMEAGSESADIMVYGAISSFKWDENDPDVTAKDFDKLLKDAKNSGAKKLNLRINSPGGEVFQAVAMRTMLLNCGMEINVAIEGLCASAATLLACVPGANVTISEGGMYMIHNPMSIVWGNAEEMEHEADMLRRMEGDFHGIYAARCGKTEDEIKGLMDAETWFTAKEAVENGFADSMIEAEPAAACVNRDMMAYMKASYAHMPDSIREEDISEEPTDTAGESTEYKNTVTKEDKTEMEIREITMEQLCTENPELYNSIRKIGAEDERQRIRDIDDLTPAGYEDMAESAKNEGMSAMDYHKNIVKAQREKKAQYLLNRKAETAQAQNVTGGAETDNDKGSEKDEIEANAKEMSEYAKTAHAQSEGMF